MFRIAEIELGMENTIGITLETGVGVQSASLYYTFAKNFKKPSPYLTFLPPPSPTYLLLPSLPYIPRTSSQPFVRDFLDCEISITIGKYLELNHGSEIFASFISCMIFAFFMS